MLDAYNIDTWIEDSGGVKPEEAYFFITDSGKKDIVTTDKTRLRQLLDAQRWRLRMMDEYEQDVLAGAVPYYTLLGFEEEPVPESVMKFMAKTMFKGIDKELIRSLYYEN